MIVYNGKKYYSTIEDNTLIKFNERDLTDKGEFIIPDGIETIQHWAFNDIQGLKVLHIPKTVKEIEQTSLLCQISQNIYCDYDNPNYKVENGCLIDKKTNIIITGTDNAEIPTGAKLGQYAFYECGKESITLDNVKCEQCAFMHSKIKKLKMKNINFGTDDQVALFFECSKLENIELINVAGRLGSFANGCENLKTITIIGGEPYCSRSHGFSFEGAVDIETIYVDNQMTIFTLLTLINSISSNMEFEQWKHDIELIFCDKNDLLKGIKSNPIISYKRSELISLPTMFDWNPYVEPNYKKSHEFIQERFGNQTAIDLLRSSIVKECNHDKSQDLEFGK